MAFGRRALRGTTPQLRSHALRPTERGRRTSAPVRSILEAREVRHRTVLAEVAMVPEDLHVPLEPPEAPGPGGS